MTSRKRMTPEDAAEIIRALRRYFPDLPPYADPTVNEEGRAS
jgi:hypothetical protein